MNLKHKINLRNQWTEILSLQCNFHLHLSNHIKSSVTILWLLWNPCCIIYGDKWVSTVIPSRWQWRWARIQYIYQRFHGIAPNKNRENFNFSSNLSEIVVFSLTQFAILVTPALYFVYNSSIGWPQWMQMNFFVAVIFLRNYFILRSVLKSIYILCGSEIKCFFVSSLVTLFTPIFLWHEWQFALQCDSECQIRFVQCVTTLGVFDVVEHDYQVWTWAFK